MFPGIAAYQSQLDVGRSYFAQKEFTKAVDVLQQIPSGSPLYQQAQDLVTEAMTADKKKTIDDLLARAAVLHKQNRGDDGLAAIRKVLDLDPTNQTAISARDEIQKAFYDRKTQGEQDQYVEETRSAAQALFVAGNLEAAKAKIAEVLVVRANDSTAAKLRQQILDQLDAVTRMNSERFRSEEARAGAEKARAVEFDQARFAQARRMQETARRLEDSKHFDEAAKRFAEAANLYSASENAARAEDQTKAENGLQLQRTQAESARAEFEQSRVKAHAAEAETKSGARFQAALAQSVDAQNRFDRGDFPGARSQFDAGTDAQASAEEARARQLAQDGKLVDATASYQRATSLWRDTVQRDAQRRDASQGLEGDRQSIRRSLDQYKTAYQTKNMSGIRAVLPTIPGAEEGSTRNNFDIARSIQMSLDLGANDVQISGDTATVAAQQRFEIRSKENQTVRSEAHSFLVCGRATDRGSSRASPEIKGRDEFSPLRGRP